MQSSILCRDSRAGTRPAPMPVSSRVFRDQRGAADRRPAAPPAATDQVGGPGRSHLRDWSGAAHDMKPRLTRSQKATIFGGINLIVTLLVILQLWLLTATMNAWLGGDSSIVLPAALASLACFALNLAGLRRVYYLQQPGE